MFSRVNIFFCFVFASVTISAQEVASKLDRSIGVILSNTESSIKHDITPGSRVFVMTPRSGAAIPPYVSERIASGLIGVLRESKFVAVYQPFLEERTLKKIESSDSILRVVHRSSVFNDFASMRVFVDSLKSYAVDLLLVPKLHINVNGELVMNLDVVDLRTLQVESSYTLFSHSKLNQLPRDTYFRINAAVGTSQSASVYRDYPQLSNGIVGPYDLSIDNHGLSFGVYQDIVRGREELKCGLLCGYESNHISSGFQDTVYQLNQFSIPAMTVGLSLELAAMSKGKNARPLISVMANAHVGKPNILDNYYSFDTRATLYLSRSIGTYFQLRFLDNIQRHGTYTDVVINQSYFLCYGIAVNI